MPFNSEFLFWASMDVDPDHEALFNEVYDHEHIPQLNKVPGVIATTRFRRQPFELNIAGETKWIESSGEPLYVAVYELDSPRVLVSPEWEKAIELGRWPSEVRPYTINRKHSLLKRI